jgi:outer membrane protein TolC
VLIGKNIKLLRSLKEQLNDSYSTNSAELSGILQVDIETANYRNKLQVVKDKQQAKTAKLSALLNFPPSFKLGKLDKLKAEKLSKNTAQLIKSAKVKRVEIARLQTDLEKMKRIIQLSEKRFYPDFDAGYSRFQNDKFTTKPKIKKNNFFAKNDAYLTETRQKYKALKSKINALKNKTADEIQQAVSSYQTQKSTRALYQNKVLPKARTSLDIAKNLYETGETSFVDVIETQELIVNYKLKSLKALKDMNIYASKVKRLVGQHK